MMLEKLEEFTGLLRKNHVRVSVSELVDATRALEAVGLASPLDLRAALAATLCKKPGDRGAFDELFTLFFLRGGDLVRGLSGAPLGGLLEDLGLDEDDVERIMAVLGDEVAGLSAAARAGLGVRGGDVVGLLRMSGIPGGGGVGGARIVSPLHLGYHTHRLLGELGVNAA